MDDGQALTRALEVANRIAGRAPLAMRQGKAMVNASLQTDMASHLVLERQAFSALFASGDTAEGIAAFINKRKPQWCGQ